MGFKLLKFDWCNNAIGMSLVYTVETITSTFEIENEMRCESKDKVLYIKKMLNNMCLCLFQVVPEKLLKFVLFLIGNFVYLYTSYIYI